MSGPRLLDLHVKAGPVSCADCRRTESNTYLLETNHWTGSYWASQHPGVCGAMNLTRNQLWYALQRGDSLDQLRRLHADTWHLWQHHPDPDPVLTQAREQIARLERLATAPQHRELVPSEEVSLW